MPTHATDAVTVRPLDIDDDAQWAAYDNAFREALRAQTPQVALYGADESRAYFRPSPAGEVVALVAWRGADVVGGAMALMPTLDHADRATVNVFVPPRHRGRGVGGALAARLVDDVAATGRTLLETAIVLPEGAREEHEYVRFAVAHGFAVGQVEVTREARLPVRGLDELAAQAAHHHDGYEIRVLADGVPDELLPGFLAVNNLIEVEAPTGDLDVEASALEAAGFRQAEATDREAGLRRLVTVALAPTGEVVAVTSIAVGTQEHLSQWGTIVRRDHRGHRLGLAVKVANLAAAQGLHPDRTRIQTTNAETNAHMVVINERLGFEVVGTQVRAQRRVDGDAR